MSDDLKGIGLYAGFIGVVFIVLCLVFSGNKVDPDDPRNLCPSELKSKLEFSATNLKGYEVADLIHCYGNYEHHFSFEYDNGETQQVYSKAMVNNNIEHKIIVDYETWHSNDDAPNVNYYKFLVVDKDSKKIDEAGVTVK